MPPHLWRCAGLRGHGGRLGRCLLAETLGLVPTGRPQEAAAQEIEVRAAKHLPFQHFQTVDVALDRPGTPRQRDPGFDGLIVLRQSGGKAAQGVQRTVGGALQPGIELGRLPLAHELGKVLGRVDGLGDRGRLRAELGECWVSASVRWASRRSTSHVARRGVKGGDVGSATTGRLSRRPWQRGGRPWAWRRRLT